MTILYAVLMLQGAPAVAPAPTADDIVVVGQRLRRLRIRTKIDRKRGVTSCVFKRRSGDPRLDAAVCTALLACVAKVTTAPEIEPCLKPTMDALVKNTPWVASPLRGGR